MVLTGTIVRLVAAGELPATLRVFQPGPTVAFGRQDRLLDGFDGAAEAARLREFVPVVREAGGRAVAYDHNSVIVEWIRPQDQIFGEINARFEQLTTLISDVLSQLDVVVELGELPDEYCPGRFSLHLLNGPKVVGAAQRVIKGASLTTAVIAVGASEPCRSVTVDVYRALGLPLDVSTVGAIADRLPHVDAQTVADTTAQRAAIRWQSGDGGP